MDLFKERLPKCERKFWKEFKKWKKRSRKHPDNTDVRNRVGKEWVTPFYTETLRGHAILQRRRRLMQPQSSKHQETPLESQESPPDYSAACGLSEAERAKEIRVLIAAFWESNRKLFRLIEDSPRANRVWYINMLHSHRDRNGRPFFWVVHRMECANTGGCCGRACKCCERPLLVFDRPADYWEPMEELGVYGHCTSECACCIAIKNEYTPHAKLPPTGLLLGQR